MSYLVGQHLYRARLQAVVSRDRAARQIRILETDLRAIERGSCSIPLCDLANLIKFYGMKRSEIAYFTSEIPQEAIRSWEMHEFAAIAMHRLCVDYDIPVPILGKILVSWI